MRTALLSMAIVLAGLLVLLALESSPEPKRDVSVTTLARRVEALRGLRFKSLPVPVKVSGSGGRTYRFAPKTGEEWIDQNFDAYSAEYTFGRAYNDTGGIGWMPPNAYDLSLEYARADFNQRHRLEAFFGAVLQRVEARGL